jgi:uncharacterized protein
MVSATRTVDPLLPAQTGVIDGLAYTLWLPAPPQPPARAGVVVVHGADSCKENHHDFARAAVALGLGAICFDQRGHGESEGPLDDRALDDVCTIAGRLRDAIGATSAPLALRGSSMGGYMALLAAGPTEARAVVAICPAGASALRRGLDEGRFGFAADRGSLRAFLDGHDLTDAARSLAAPVLLLHAEGDERVPIQHSRELAAAVTAPGSRLIAVPGGHHRSIQHDEELQTVSLRFIVRALGPARPQLSG